MKQTLINLYLEYVNDYLTVSTMSEHKGLDSEDMEVLINMGKKYHEENVSLMRDLDEADRQINMSTLKSFVKPMTHLMGLSTGWGNGYVILPKDHELYGKHYDEINEIVEVHGGLTFSKNANSIDWPEMEGVTEGWVVGFDTAHAWDDPENCTREYVESETEYLKQQLEY